MSIVTIAVLLLSVALTQPENKAVPEQFGEYDVNVKIIDFDYELNIATADVRITAQLLPTTKIVYIALPFVLSPRGRFLVEASSDRNLIFFGDLRPVDNCSVIQIYPGATQTALTLTLTEVHLMMGDSAAAKSGKALHLQFEAAHLKASRRIDNLAAPRLTKLTVVSEGISYSEPAGRRQGIESTYYIEFPAAQIIPVNITLFLSEQRSRYLPLILPLVLGLPLGIFAGVLIIKSKDSAKKILVISLVVLVIIIILAIIFFPVVYSYLDNDILLAFSSLIGIPIGLILSSIYIIRKQP